MILLTHLFPNLDRAQNIGAKNITHKISNVNYIVGENDSGKIAGAAHSAFVFLSAKPLSPNCNNWITVLWVVYMLRLIAAAIAH